VNIQPGYAGFVHCRDPASTKPEFLLAFDRAASRAKYIVMPAGICMYVCMYVCMCACMHACMYVCMYACMHAGRN
jgi:hypothetical protein